MRKYLVVLIVIVILAVILIIFGNRFLNKKSASSENAFPGQSQTTNPSAAPAQDQTNAGFVNPSATIDAIDTAFSKNEKALGADLGAYMANSVQVVIYGSAGVNRERKEASRILDSYLRNGSSPWKCDTGDPMEYQNNTVARNLGKANPEFTDALVCISNNSYLAAFTYDNEFLINKIILSSNYKSIIK